MNTKNLSKILLPAVIGTASLLLSGTLFGTYTIQDDLVVEGDAILEQSLEIQGNSFAYGPGSEASGHAALAGGSWSTASGNYSIGLGDYALALGYSAISLGQWNLTDGYGSFAVGEANTSSGIGSAAIGLGTTASGLLSTSFGNATTASGDHTTAFGGYTIAQGSHQVVIGRYNEAQGSATSWDDSDDIFIIGNGTDSSNRSNALSVQKNGNAEFAGTVRVQPGGDISMGQYTSGQ